MTAPPLVVGQVVPHPDDRKALMQVVQVGGANGPVYRFLGRLK